MIITRQAINATYEENTSLMNMIYSVLINHVGDDINDYDVARHIKTNCANQTKGTYIDSSYLLKIVKDHVKKYQ